MTAYNSSLLELEVVEMDDILSNPEILAIARSLTINPMSGMNFALDYYTELSKTRSINARGIFAMYADLTVGWALFTREHDNHSFYAAEGNSCGQIYVHPDWRRRGIGKKLIDAVAELAQPDVLKVYEWSAPGFFRSVMTQFAHIQSI